MQPDRDRDQDCPPDRFEKGYQPLKQPAPEPTPQGGYQPTSQGDNPANQPPGEE